MGICKVYPPSKFIITRNCLSALKNSVKGILCYREDVQNVCMNFNFCFWRNVFFISSHQNCSEHFSLNFLQLPSSVIQKLLSATPPSESNLFRVDFRSGYVHYLNNIEEDAMYKRWRSNINEVLLFYYSIWTKLKLFIFLSLCYFFMIMLLKLFVSDSVDIDAGLPWSASLHSKKFVPCCICFWSCN